VKRLLLILTRSHSSLKFAQVGAIGFLVDSLVLLFLYEFVEIELFLARGIAFLCAASSNWFLNRVFTFSGSSSTSPKSVEWGRFIISAMLSAIPNLGIFYLLTRFLPESLGYIYFAMCCGILTGYYCNYQLARRWVFKAGLQDTNGLD
jgi:putative flippase GtrA